MEMNRSQRGPDRGVRCCMRQAGNSGRGRGDFILPVPGDTGKAFPQVGTVKLGPKI